MHTFSKIALVAAVLALPFLAVSCDTLNGTSSAPASETTQAQTVVLEDPVAVARAACPRCTVQPPPPPEMSLSPADKQWIQQQLARSRRASGTTTSEALTRQAAATAATATVSTPTATATATVAQAPAASASASASADTRPALPVIVVDRTRYADPAWRVEVGRMPTGRPYCTIHWPEGAPGEAKDSFFAETCVRHGLAQDAHAGRARL